MLAILSVERRKLGVYEGSELVYSDGSLEVLNENNPEGAVYLL